MIVKNFNFLLILLSILIAIGLSACSSSLPDPENTETDICSEVKVTKTNGSPSVLKLNDENNAFISSITQCGILDSMPNRALSRELLVGFENVKFTSQNNIHSRSQPANITVSRVKAELDGTPLNLLILTARHKNCITDTVLWGQANENGELLDKESEDSLVTCLANSK